MKTFLEYVADDIVSKFGTNLARTAIIFPNKRARLFFNEHLARQVSGPIWSPAYLTISELFRRHSTLNVADQIKLICDLHKSFAEVTGSGETLDHFYSWGQIMLTDFDDIDKNLADARQIFKNVGDLHELDDLTYLSPEQMEMLKRFFSNFSENKQSELKRRFMTLWSRFYEIYQNFNSRLLAQNYAYEGALYRAVADDESITFDFDRYIFVGFNLLQRVEQKLFTRLKDKGKAFFYWDFDHYYMPDKTRGKVSEAGHYIASYLGEFPNELGNDNRDIYNCFEKPKTIKFITAPTESIQAVYAAQWLKQDNRIGCGRKTAVVMCNEALLQSVVHNIPNEADKINITTGYPLSQSPFCPLITMLISLRTEGFLADKNRYKLRFVNRLLKHPYIKYVSEKSAELYAELNGEAKLFFVEPDTLAKDEGLHLLFGPLDAEEPAMTGKILKWTMALLKQIAANVDDSTDQFFKESLFRVYTIINRLYDLVASGDLAIDIITLQRLLRQVLQSSSIPFHGEPAVGVQFMGVLETRNIDFDHLLILSCNEGNMPKGVNDTSFIPYSIRKAHGLTTIDNKVAIYAYYFYRLLQRATDISLVYNNSTDGMSTGEMSRFMLQIMLESRHVIEKQSIVSAISTASHRAASVEKTDDVMQRLLSHFDKSRHPHTNRALLTPTSIATYCRCQLRYYYRYVLGLTEEYESDEEGVDNIQFGLIFHNDSQAIYKSLQSDYGPVVQRAHLEKYHNDENNLMDVVKKTLDHEVFNLNEKSNVRPDYNGLQLINIKVLTTYLKQLLKSDMELAPFKILGLEKDVVEEIEVRMGNTGKTFKSTIGGIIDRLDQVIDDEGRQHIRVVDYKTGGGRFANNLADVADIFDTKNIATHSDYYMQTIIYSNIVRHSPSLNQMSLPVSPALLFIQHNQKSSPVLKLGKDNISDVADIEVEFRTKLDDLLSEIFNPDINFTPTTEAKRCSSCPFVKMCR